jgi:hypothetical protein
MEKTIVITISLLFYSTFNLLYCQHSSQRKFNGEDGYYESLKLHIEHMQGITPNLDTLLVLERNYLPDFPRSVEGVSIRMVDPNYIFEKTKRRKHISIINIGALEFEQEKPVIYVVEFDVHRKRKHYTWENVYRSKIALEYDCAKGRFEYSILRH